MTVRTFGTNAVDGEQCRDRDRLRPDRPARVGARLASSSVGAQLASSSVGAVRRLVSY